MAILHWWILATWKTEWLQYSELLITCKQNSASNYKFMSKYVCMQKIKMQQFLAKDVLSNFSKYAVTICTFLEVCSKVCTYPASHVTLKVWPITFHYSVKWPKFHGLVSQGFCWPIFVRQLDNCKLLIVPRQFWQIFDYLTICTNPFLLVI